MLTDEERRGLCDRLTAATVDLVADCGSSVEVQLFGFGVRLIPPDGAAILAWFLVPGRDELFVSVGPGDLCWEVDPVAPDAVDQVLALVRAGVAGRMVVRAGLRTQGITATLDDGRAVTSSSSRSRFRRRPSGGRIRRRLSFPPYPTQGGAARLRDVAEPPPQLTSWLADVAPAVAAGGHRLELTFVVAGVHGLPTFDGQAVFGWRARAVRSDGTPALSVWWDGNDAELVVHDGVREHAWWDPGEDAGARAEAVEVIRRTLMGHRPPTS